MSRQLQRDFVTCLAFNGSSSKVTSTIWSTATNNVTVSAWFRTSNWKTANQCIWLNGSNVGGTGRGYGLFLNGNSVTDGTMYLLDPFFTWYSMSFKVQDNNWHHIVMTRTSGNLTTVYLDGVQRYQGSPTFHTPITGSFIGHDNGTTYFLGLIDDVRFFTTSLSSTDAIGLYYGNDPTTLPTNKYLLDEGSGTTAIDSGSSPKNGTIANATYSTNVFMKPRSVASGRLLVERDGPFALIQSKQTASGSTASLVHTFATATTQNNLVIANVKVAQIGATPTSVVDSAGNTYALAGSQEVNIGGSPITVYQYYGVQTTGGATTLTVNLPSAQAIRICVEEFSGGLTTNATVFDKVATNLGGGADTSASLTLAPSKAGELISVFLVTTGGGTFTAGSNYTIGTQNTNGTSEYRLSSLTSETAPISWTSGTISGWAEIAGAYLPKLAPGRVLIT